MGNTVVVVVGAGIGTGVGVGVIVVVVVASIGGVTVILGAIISNSKLRQLLYSSFSAITLLLSKQI